MKKLLLLIVIVVVAWIIYAKMTSSPKVPGQSMSGSEREYITTTSPGPTTPVEPSAKLKRVLDWHSSTSEVNQETDIRNLRLLTMLNDLPGDEYAIFIQIEEDVDAVVRGRWHNKTNRQILDDICHQRGLAWEIVGPETIRIRNAP